MHHVFPLSFHTKAGTGSMEIVQRSQNGNASLNNWAHRHHTIVVVLLMRSLRWRGTDGRTLALALHLSPPLRCQCTQKIPLIAQSSLPCYGLDWPVYTSAFRVYVKGKGIFCIQLDNTDDAQCVEVKSHLHRSTGPKIKDQPIAAVFLLQ